MHICSNFCSKTFVKTTFILRSLKDKRKTLHCKSSYLFYLLLKNYCYSNIHSFIHSEKFKKLINVLTYFDFKVLNFTFIKYNEYYIQSGPLNVSCLAPLLKVAFFEKVRFVFQISKSPPKKYSKSLS